MDLVHQLQNTMRSSVVVPMLMAKPVPGDHGHVVGVSILGTRQRKPKLITHTHIGQYVFLSVSQNVSPGPAIIHPI
jgi:hypothetical protein